MPILPDKLFLRPDEAAKFLSITRKTIYLWVEQGKLDAVKINGLIRIPREAIGKIQKSVFE